ncbi:MAG: deoxynucleoside kinase [Bacteroidia bacterium]|nr:deoxynucleoside kinase [Bacteroidia bacterium]
MHIAIAGNIGSGKTTLTTLLAKHMSWEPQYEELSSNPYIYDFYADMERWAFNLQVYFLHSRLNTTLQIQRSAKNVVQDRTIYEDAEIFAPNLLQMELMNQRDYDNYKALFNVITQLIQPPDLLIYLKASIPTLVEQIEARGRDYEDSIRLEYLRKLNERYNLWFENYKGKKLEFSIDTLKFRDNPEDLGIIIRSIESKLYGLFPE